MSAGMGRSGRRWYLLIAVVCLGAGLSIVSGVRTAHAQGGTVTNYTGTGIGSPAEIAAGPDGALWFTNSNNNSIGRITTTGAVTNFTGTGVSTPNGITAGPDGALWFTNIGNNSIGRITTTGAVTNYTDPTIGEPVDRGGVRRGPVVHQFQQQQHRADHHRRCRHQLHRYRHQPPGRDHRWARRSAVVHQPG